MIADRTIICLASGWDYHPTSKHHVMRKLAERNQVLWVNWHASRCPRLNLGDLHSIVSKIGQIGQGPRQAVESLTVLTPPQIPLPGSPLIRKLNAAIVRRAINKVLKRLPPRPVQLWSFAPDIGELVGGFDEELVLYYCVDAFGEFPGYDRALIERCERELMDQCDLVITTSPPLYETRRQWHPRVHLVKHGVDHARLSRAVHESLPIPASLKGLPHPILGFVGVIGEWVDLDMVAGLARRLPDASIVMIGPEKISRGPCRGLSNIHWLGNKAHEELPSYLRYFDVGLIPFRDVPLTYYANPIKLFEYLAAGVPVVSSPLPVIKPIPGMIWLADDMASAVDGCRQACNDNSPAARQQRSQLMLAESWTARLDQIAEQVNAAIKDRRTVKVDAAMPSSTVRMEMRSA
ncbi:MAG: glycosyltransferase family 1 protein [Phycisphaerales bacterium]|nr:glycosyltransferase family 1 protein [Phycisphaerales bacterium]